MVKKVYESPEHGAFVPDQRPKSSIHSHKVYIITYLAAEIVIVMGSD